MSVVRATQPGNNAGAGNATQNARNWKQYARRGAFTLGALLVVSIPWSGPRLLAQLEYFNVRRVEFQGLQFALASELLEAAKVDTSRSIWNDLLPVLRRVQKHPMVASATIERRLPGTLVVHIVERQPLALVQRKGLLAPTDVNGRELPIDLSRTPLDLPVAFSPDSTILRVLDALHRFAPEIYSRVITVRRAGPDELLFDFGVFSVRTRDDVTAARFGDILPVEADLARDHLRAVELDLRFQDQVIVRQP